MCRSGIALIVLALTSAEALGQSQKFPFDAIVDATDAYVRSGPGERFYPTGKLRRGSQVTVVRKDFGGWYMITPPEGSFSWVRSEYVDRAANGLGTVNTDNVVIRVGSAFGDDVRDVEQRRMSSGDQVVVLEQVSLESDGKTVNYLKIRPPKGEYRWILGKAIVAKDAAVRSRQDLNPFQVPSQVRRSGDLPSPGTVETGPDSRLVADADKQSEIKTQGIVERPVTRFQDQQSVRRTIAPPERLTADRERLNELDQVFREMIRRDTSEWEFSGLEKGYRELHERAASPAMKRQVEQRYPALQKYQLIKREYDDFVMLTRETQARDAQLLSLQTRQPAGTIEAPPVTDSKAPTPTGRDSTIAAPNSVPAGQRPHPKFVGAGVIQRLGTVPGGRPQFVLIAPDGRLLAHLQGGKGVNLNQYVGRSMGLEGRRWYRPELQGDYIVVESLTPVRLRAPERP